MVAVSVLRGVGGVRCGIHRQNDLENSGQQDDPGEKPGWQIASLRGFAMAHTNDLNMARLRGNFNEMLHRRAIICFSCTVNFVKVRVE